MPKAMNFKKVTIASSRRDASGPVVGPVELLAVRSYAVLECVGKLGDLGHAEKQLLDARLTVPILAFDHGHFGPAEHGPSRPPDRAGYAHRPSCRPSTSTSLAAEQRISLAPMGDA